MSVLRCYECGCVYAIEGHSEDCSQGATATKAVEQPLVLDEVRSLAIKCLEYHERHWKQNSEQTGSIESGCRAKRAREQIAALATKAVEQPLVLDEAFERVRRQAEYCREHGAHFVTGVVTDDLLAALRSSPLVLDEVERAKWQIWERALELELPLVQADAEELARAAISAARR